jgi:hypothetical protein
MKSALIFHLQGLVEDSEEIPKSRGVQSYLDTERDSKGEEYYITHIVVNDITMFALFRHPVSES